MIIDVRNISKEIKNNSILSNCTIQLSSGKIYGLKGKNGSGKTMLLRAICGLIKLNEGEIYIDDMCLGRDMDFPRSVGLMIENSGFHGGLTAYDNLSMLASIKKIASQKDIENTIDRVGLAEDSGKKYRQYSLGMRQKLGIAAAIFEQPDLIILDEPTNGLDVESVIRLRNILAEEKNRGALIIVASHDFDEIGELVDEMYLMKAGKLEKI